MLNIDSRLLTKVNADELYLLAMITDRVNAEGKAWPGNNLLLQNTNWGIEKLQKVKKSLYEKGIIKVNIRKSGKRQTSNSYQLQTNLISKYSGSGKTDIGFSGGVGKSGIPPMPENQISPGSGKSGREIYRSINHEEVLGKEEVLGNRESMPIEIFEIFRNSFFSSVPGHTSGTAVENNLRKKIFEAAGQVYEFYKKNTPSVFPEWVGGGNGNPYQAYVHQVEAHSDYLRLTNSKPAIVPTTIAQTIISRDWTNLLYDFVNNNAYDPIEDNNLLSSWVMEIFYDVTIAYIDKRNPDRIIF